MGFWWYGVSTFNHVHAAIILIALLPFPTPRFWKRIMEFSLVQFVTRWLFDYWKFYLCCFFIFLLSFMDSLRSYYKYSAVEYELYADAETRKDARLALLLSQRNYFISGSACIMSLIMPRLLSVLNENAKSSVQLETARHAARLFQELVQVMEMDRGDDNTHRRRGRVPQENADSNLIDFLRIGLDSLVREFERNQQTQPLTTTEVREIMEHIERQRIQNAVPNTSHPRTQRSVLTSTIPRDQRHSQPLPPLRPRNRFSIF